MHISYPIPHRVLNANSLCRGSAVGVITGLNHRATGGAVTPVIWGT